MSSLPIESRQLRIPGVIEATVLSAGGALASLRVADSAGVMGEVVLALPRLTDYLDNRAFVGSLIGRYANRIAGPSVALDGAFLLCKAVVPHMIRRGGGAIVALSGISTHIGMKNRPHVSASKAGLEGRQVALAELAAELQTQLGQIDECEESEKQEHKQMHYELH